MLHVRGSVQGVGFRPYVYRTAVRLGIAGGVWNATGGVVVDAEGEPEALDRLRAALFEAPLPARVENVEETAAGATVGGPGFGIRPSRVENRSTPRVPADLATCASCLRELFDPADRRFRYPFIACAECGPRYTAVLGTPYDRARTSYEPFPPCPACRAEYDDPASRRFHAQAIACPDCGPRVWADGDGSNDPVAAAVHALRAGGVVAVRGVGGVHLACDASDERAVGRLRAAKNRADKPFAVMFPGLEMLGRECVVDALALAALCGPESPIVLLPRRESTTLAPAVAPGLTEIGAFLPSWGLQHLLLAAYGAPLVMTSGNLSDEPIAVTNEEARARLGAWCDLLLLHDREIPGRADDSVVRVIAHAPRVFRRARGHAPGHFDLGFAAPDVCAVGADIRNTLCITRGREAFLSPHIGDLAGLDTQNAWAETRERMERLFHARPTAVAHDLHPGYHGTALALATGLPALAVQHHHAHVASCLVENGHPGPVIGVAWDGTGYGTDGTVWGGEFLVADLARFERRARLRPVALAGGDAAVREGWRMAIAYLMDAGLDPARIDARGAGTVARMISCGTGTVPTSSMGRLFDAVAALVGLRGASTYEGQAALELEALAARDGEPYVLPVIRSGELLELDPRAMIRAVVADVDAGVGSAEISARFHAALSVALAAACRAIRDETGLRTVALTGGCFGNRRLTELAAQALGADGFEVLLHSRVPAGDGGLALGQAAVAARRISDVPGHPR